MCSCRHISGEPWHPGTILDTLGGFLWAEVHNAGRHIWTHHPATLRSHGDKTHRLQGYKSSHPNTGICIRSNQLNLRRAYLLQRALLGYKGSSSALKSPRICGLGPTTIGHKTKIKIQHNQRLLQWTCLTLLLSCHGNSKQNIFSWYSENFHCGSNPCVCSDHTESLMTSFACYIGTPNMLRRLPTKG